MIGHILNICTEQKKRMESKFTQSESVTRQRLPYSELYIRACAYRFKKWLINAYAKCFKRRNISVKNNDVR